MNTKPTVTPSVKQFLAAAVVWTTLTASYGAFVTLVVNR